MLQDFGRFDVSPNAMNASGQRYKKIVYDFDLVSGKVNQVSYQPGQEDAFYHRYSYDAENRLTDVFTGRDSVQLFLFPEREAHYTYYKHGPLARTDIGQLRVQGQDFVYTLQGWIKGVNPAMGGTLTNGTDTTEASPTAQDVYGYSLNYYRGDYKAIGYTPQTHTVIGQLSSNGAALYNGNIATMAVNIPKLGATRLYNYHYDQLNRIVSMDAFSGLDPVAGTFTPVSLSDYRERVTYDPNGNILTYNRHGDAARLSMDSMLYSYTAGTNRLHKVSDYATDASSGTYAQYNDLKQGQSDNNYQYDQIGNLIYDGSEGISNITWNVYGKIETVTKSGTVIRYVYDASGNRIIKKTPTDTTFYVRDASGNVLSVYSRPVAGTLQQAEIHLYGSSRIGMLTTRSAADTFFNLSGGFAKIKGIKFTRGEKLFELSNHLGNVLVAISDRKIAIQNGTTGLNSHYLADISSAQDYYPFGMCMPGRKYEAQIGYRYGYSGKEKDNEIKGNGNILDFGARIYDNRLGRWLSTDPLQSQYPDVSPYSYCYNNPIHFTDENGKWVRDQNGNVIVTIDKKMTIERGGVYAIGNASTQYVIQGNWGYIMSNNGTKVEVFVPTSNTVTKATFDAQGNVTGTTDVTSSCDGEKNCTTNSLLPSTSSIVISSDQITDDILESEGFIKGSEIEKNVQDLANSGDKAAQGFSINKITQQGDIVVYGTGSGKYEHFEYFQNSTTVDTKGGVQKGPINASPGQNPSFSSPQTYINTNVGGWKDLKINTSGGKTANGQTIVDNKQFDKIQNDVKAKTL